MELILFVKLLICNLLLGLEVKHFELTILACCIKVLLFFVSLTLGEYSLKLEPCFLSLFFDIILDDDTLFSTHVEILAISRAIDTLPSNFFMADLLDPTLEVPTLKASLIMLSTLLSVTNMHILLIWRNNCPVDLLTFLQW